MDRMNATENISDIHVGWPTIFPQVPEFMIHALTMWHDQATKARACAMNYAYVGDRNVAQGQAFGFDSAMMWLAEDLARCMYFGDGDALVWAETR